MLLENEALPRVPQAAYSEKRACSRVRTSASTSKATMVQLPAVVYKVRRGLLESAVLLD